MSHVVRTAVRRHSQATRATLAILKELADFAHHDGVTWISQATLVKETTYSEREVRGAIRWLEQMVELETRKAQRGRSRINVYRVIVGPIGAIEPDYDKLPFDLPEPFSPPAAIAARRSALAAKPAPALPGETGPDDHRHTLPVETDADDRQSKHLTTGSPTRARAEEDPSGNHQRREANASLLPADAGERESSTFEISLALSAELGVDLTGLTRLERRDWQVAIADLANVQASGADVAARCTAYRTVWPTMRLTPFALVRHWSMLGAHVEIAAAVDPLERWLEIATQFERDDAHAILDDRPGLDNETRAAYHRRLDQAFDAKRQQVA